MSKENDLKVKQENPNSKGSDQTEDKKGGDSSDKYSKTEDGKIAVPEEDLKKLKEDRDNYKKGLLSYKQKLNEAKKDDSPSKEENTSPEKEEYVTKKEFHDANEKKAIRVAVEKAGEQLKENWEDVMEYYTPRRGKEVVDDIVEDINDAFYLFKKNNPDKFSEEDSNAKARLSRGSGGGGKTSPTEDEDKKPAKQKGRKILKKSKSPQEWY